MIEPHVLKRNMVHNWPIPVVKINLGSKLSSDLALLLGIKGEKMNTRVYWGMLERVASVGNEKVRLAVANSFFRKDSLAFVEVTFGELEEIMHFFQKPLVVGEVVCIQCEKNNEDIDVYNKIVSLSMYPNRGGVITTWNFDV